MNILEAKEKLNSIKVQNITPIILKELNPTSRTEIKYVIDTADLIDDDPEDYTKWTSKNVKEDLILGRRFFLFLKGENVIGSIGIKVYENGVVDLYNFGVFPKYQGNGYGRKSLSTIIRYILEKYPNTSEIHICVYKTSRIALHLYKTMGFKIEEIWDKMYFMVKKIKESE